jgi:hypothetical protein
MKAKVVPIKKKAGTKPNESGRLSLDVCREILNRQDRKFTDEQVIRIRNYLYKLADIAIEEFEWQEKKQCQVINMNEYKKSKDEKSHSLRAS